MLDLRLTVESWGNISIRCPKSGLVYITPSAMPYYDLTADDIVVTDICGNIVDGSRKPSIEKALHLLIYRNRPEINAVIHTHPIYSTVFAALNESIPPILDEAAQVFGGNVEVAEYALPGTKELAINCACALGDAGMACLLAYHGAVCIGRDIHEAFKVCSILETTARILYMARCIGDPKPLSADIVQKLNEFAQQSYGQQKQHEYKI